MRVRAVGQHERGDRGFTLIEVLIVMMIIAIMFFAVLPAFLGVQRGWQERNAMRQLVSLFVATRAEAVAGGKLIRVVYDASSGSFFAEVQSHPEEDRQLFDPVALMGKRSVRLPDSLKLESIEVSGISLAESEMPAVYFYPDGRTDGAIIALAKASGGAVSLEIAPATGRVRLDA